MSIYKKFLNSLSARRHEVVFSSKTTQEKTTLFQRISTAMTWLQKKRDQTKKPPVV